MPRRDHVPGPLAWHAGVDGGDSVLLEAVIGVPDGGCNLGVLVHDVGEEAHHLVGQRLGSEDLRLETQAQREREAVLDGVALSEALDSQLSDLCVERGALGSDIGWCRCCVGHPAASVESVSLIPGAVGGGGGGCSSRISGAFMS